MVRDPCEYAAAIVAANRSIRSAQVGISQATVSGVRSTSRLRHSSNTDPASPPRSLRRPTSAGSPPYSTRRCFRPRCAIGHAARLRAEPLPEWWDEGSNTSTTRRSSPLVYLTFGTVLPYLSFAADAYRFALEALSSLDARVLLTVGRNFPSINSARCPERARRIVVRSGRALRRRSGRRLPRWLGHAPRRHRRSVPMVVMPFFSDQRSNGRLVDRYRLGRVVAPTSSPDDQRPTFDQADARRLSDAVEELLAHARPCRRILLGHGLVDDTPHPAQILADM